MRFTKMQGLGNDYVYVNAFQEHIDNPAQVARKISDRHFGIGSDGLILVAPPTEAGTAQGAQIRMRMFNADGSEAEMCGNGVRCVAKFAYEHNLCRANPMKIETGRGVLSLDLHLIEQKVEKVTVNMGTPILELARIPVDEQWVSPGSQEHQYLIVPNLATAAPAGPRLVEASHGIPAYFVSMGNPHMIVFTPEVAAVDLEKIGPVLEKHRAFPNRINVHFVGVHSPEEVTMRTWERGSGITLACGTGAAAVCVAGVLAGKTGRKILAHLPGGDLTLEWRQSDNHVYKTGPAVEVFSGEWHG